MSTTEAAARVTRARQRRDRAAIFEHPSYNKAFLMATDAHEGQYRWDGEDYVAHVIRVAHSVARAGGSLYQVVAALLHDIVEDTSVTVDMIREEFGAEVADLVAVLTHDPTETYSQYILRICGTDAVLIKVADICDNMSTLLGWGTVDGQEYRFNKYRNALGVLGAHFFAPF